MDNSIGQAASREHPITYRITLGPGGPINAAWLYQVAEAIEERVNEEMKDVAPGTSVTAIPEDAALEIDLVLVVVDEAEVYRGMARVARIVEKESGFSKAPPKRDVHSPLVVVDAWDQEIVPHDSHALVPA